jgi:replication initiation protein RepC
MDPVSRQLGLAHRQATGLRKLTPRMLGTIEVAETHAFTSEMLPGQVLAAFKAAAPYLGLRPGVVHAIDWLFRFTDPLDWQPTSKPIVWPSAAMQQLELGLGPSQVKNLNRQLVELGLIAMKDSPNGKRYGRRDHKGRIIEAYGFDLSPMASRFAEFRAQAEAGREERARIQALRRRATIARNGVRQLVETAREQRLSGEEWEALTETASRASRGLAALGSSTKMEAAVSRLEQVQIDMRRHLEESLNIEPHSVPVNNNPKTPENWPHITTTNQLLNPKDTVIAPQKSRFRPETSGAQDPASRLGQGQMPGKTEEKVRTDDGTVMRIHPRELVHLAPRLKPYLTTSSPAWPDIVEAADWLRHDLKVSKPLWGDACLALGRERAAIALAIVSAKPESHFTASPGSYFHGMVRRAKAGQLNLSRTIWGLRENPGRTGRAGG